MPQYLGSESKVIGGRRTHSVLLTSSQNKENNSSSHRLLSSNSTTSACKLLNGTNRPLKTVTLTHRRGNTLAIEISDDENDMDMKKSPTPGCLKSLKRKRLKFIENGQASYEKLPKDISNVSHEKENRNLSKLSISTDANAEPAPKKRRLGPHHPGVPITQPKAKPSFFAKTLMKLKTENLFSKHSKAQKSVPTESCQPENSDTSRGDPKQEVEIKTKPEILRVQADPTDLKSMISSNFITDMFHGQLVTTIKCMECESKVNRYESFQVKISRILSKLYKQ